MKTRIASITMVTAILAFGLPSVALSSTGDSSSANAAGTQYQPETTGTVPVVPPEEQPPAPPDEPLVETSVPSAIPAPPVEAEATVETPTAKATPSNETVADVAPAPVAEAQTAEGSLPFTGYDALPVAIIGLALLALGFGLRHQTRHRRN